MGDLRQRVLHGFRWSAMERMLSQGCGLVFSILIARILSPSDYGIVAMISMFTGLAAELSGGGFTAALIRKQDRTDADFCTVFYYTVGVSVVLYLCLYTLAPLIAEFYDSPVLVSITRVVAVGVIVSALGAVHSAKLIIAIDFKTQTKISLIALGISGTLGIGMALGGFGVWTLVAQGLAFSIVCNIALWCFVRWRPRPVFSRNSFRSMFGFGSKLMLSGLLDTTFKNIYRVVIGKRFSAADLGYFTKAETLVTLPSSNVTNMIQRVTFPMLSEMQTDGTRLQTSFRRLIRTSAFVVFPMMMLLCGLGEPLVRTVLGEKWLPTVPLMQVLCFSYMIYPMHAINLNLLQVKGRSDLFLKLEIFKKAVIAVVLVVSAPFGVLAMCYGMIVSGVVALVANTHYTGRLIGVGCLMQVKDVVPAFLLSVITGAIAWGPKFFLDAASEQVVVGAMLGGMSFAGGCWLFLRREAADVATVLFGSREYG